MTEAIVLTVPTLVMCIAFLCYVISNNNFALKTNLLFCSASVTIILLAVADAVRFAIPAEKTTAKLWVYAATYFLRTAILYTVTLISYRNYSKPSLLEFTISLPLIITLINSVLSVNTGIAFSFDAAGNFVYGPLYFVPFVACGFYCVLLFILTVNNYRIKDYHEFISLISLLSVCVLSTVLEAALKFRYILAGTAIIAVAFYNMLLHNNTNSRDRLTGCPIRRRFYEDGSWKIVSAVIMIDLNGLKRINDKFGHAEGDRALCSLVSTIESKIGKSKATLYRLGGDEFAVLCTRMSENDVLAITYGIRAGMEYTPYTCAIGYAMRDEGTEFDDLVKKADAEMYKDKMIIKGKMSEQ